MATEAIPSHNKCKVIAVVAAVVFVDVTVAVVISPPPHTHTHPYPKEKVISNELCWEKNMENINWFKMFKTISARMKAKSL